MKENSKIKVGVVGVGHLGRFHVEQYQLINVVDLVGFFDIDIKASQNVSNILNVKSYDCLDDLLDVCDAVSICTPTSTHFEISKKVIYKRCHLFIEKPITNNVRQARELISLSKKNNTLVQIGHIERFNPAFFALNKENINPRFIESHRLSPFNVRGTDVDVILDLMIHDIDILITIVKSNIKLILASGVSVLSDKIDMANTRIEFESGCVANMTVSRISQKTLRKFRIFEKNSYTNIDFLNPCVEKYILSNERPKNDFSYVVINENKEKYILYDKPKINLHNALKVELQCFAESIQVSEEPVVSGNDGLRALEIAMQIRDKINTKAFN